MNAAKCTIKIFTFMLVLLLFLMPPVNANDFYTEGMQALERKDYSGAIEYLKKALKAEPNSTTILNNLAVTYTSKGTNLYNQNKDLEIAANDYRNAIFYLEFYNKSANTPTMNQNIPIAHQNLMRILEIQKFKTDSANRLKKAKELRGKGEFEASIVEYSYAAKDKKYSYESYVAIGDVMKNLGNDYNAAIYYDKALAQDSSDAYIHLKLAKALYNLGNIDTAVRELDIALASQNTKSEALMLLETIWKNRADKKPNDPVAQMNLGVVYQNKGEYTLAMEQYKKAQAIDPKNQMIKLNIATLLQQQGNYKEALDSYNEILKLRPNDALILGYKANTLYKLGNKEAALILYQTLLTNNPNNSDIKHDILDIINESPENVALSALSDLSQKFPNDIDFLYNYAYALHKAKKYDDALLYYKKVIAIDNKNVDAYLNLASIYKQKNDTANALNTLNTAKLYISNNDKINQLIGDYNEEKKFLLMEKAANLYNNKDYNDAIITYKSIENPTEEVYLGIGACYQAMERYADAITYYNKAISIDNSNPNAYYFLGLAYLYKKDFNNAETALKKAKELDDINPDIDDAIKSLKFEKSEQQMNIGIKLFENNKNDDAIINFTKALTICPENGYAYYYRGLAYDTKGQNNSAISDYKKAVELNPELNMAYYSMGLSYDALKNKTEAKKMYQKFLSETASDDEYTQYAKQRLKEL